MRVRNERAKFLELLISAASARAGRRAKKVSPGALASLDRYERRAASRRQKALGNLSELGRLPIFKSARSLSTAETCQPGRGSGRASLRMMTEATMAARTDQKWSAALIRRMARLANREMSTAQIAKALGLTRGQVLGKMHRLGLKTKNPPRKRLNTALVKKVTELIDQRLSASQIGQALGLTRRQVT
jgi:biotin operon repressor